MTTLGTLLKTFVSGELVGTDNYGNRYYRGRTRNRYNRERRWVVYKGRPEASKVPPEWHVWLHHISEEPIDQGLRHSWQQEHVPNLTGTRAAYRPSGSVMQPGERRRGTGEYEPWTPQ
jgi:NADH:ubiquinone oxidoreductase subunit